MRVAVELTYDDFREASAAARAAVAEKQRRKMRRSPGLIVGAALGGLVIFLLLTLGSDLPFDPFSHLRPPLYWSLTLILPFALIAVFALALGAVQQGIRLKNMIGVGLPLVGLGLLLFFLNLLSGQTAVGPGGGYYIGPRDWFGTLAPHMPWVIITAMVAAVTARSLRDQTRVAWDAYAPHLRRKVYDITAEGLSVDEGVSRAQYAWAAFARFQETPNLLLLCPTDLTFEVLPKRAFATPEDLAAARHLFATQIYDAASTATQAFPVVSASPALSSSTPQPAAPVPPPLPAQQA